MLEIGIIGITLVSLLLSCIGWADEVVNGRARKFAERKKKIAAVKMKKIQEPK